MPQKLKLSSVLLWLPARSRARALRRSVDVCKVGEHGPWSNRPILRSGRRLSRVDRPRQLDTWPVERADIATYQLE
ncbi:hypothetical protein J6590_071697 [Homalodisca vitripennis]|nr:hypothetical protein J6590_071697 [Homalodisca vitripennis]